MTRVYLFSTDLRPQTGREAPEQCTGEGWVDSLREDQRHTFDGDGEDQTNLDDAVDVRELQVSEDLDGEDVDVQKNWVGAAQHSQRAEKDRGEQLDL